MVNIDVLLQITCSVGSLVSLEGSLHFGVNLFLSLGVVKLEVSNPLAALGVLEYPSVAWGNNSLSWLFVTCLLLSFWLGNDSRMHFGVEVLAGLYLGGGEALLPLGELLLENGWVFLFQQLHVGVNVVAENVSSKNFGVEFSLSLLSVNDLSSLTLDFLDGSFLVTWESLGLMRHVEATIASTLEDREYSGTSGGWGKTNIEEGLEWSLIIIHILLNIEEATVSLIVSLIS